MHVKEQPAIYAVDQDGLWKKVIGDLFEDFLLFFNPDLHAHIDFTKPPDFLQQELFQLVNDRKKGRGVADQIVKVQMKEGSEQWVLIHVEVQGADQEDFSARMFQYFYRIYDRYREKIFALAIMTAPHESKAPADFHYQFFGTTLQYAYTTRKLLDYSEEELEKSDKLFSKVVMAAKYLHLTKDQEQQRYQFKMKLMRDIVRNEKYPRTAVQAVFHFIDYLLKLPKDLELKLAQTMYPILGEEEQLMELYNKENASPTISNAFHMERVEGRLEGRLEGEKKARFHVVQNMLKKDWSIEDIADVTGLSEEDILAIRDEMVQ
ncbi:MULTISPECIES: hypothetical protein [unclassified Sporosarcina]|uniref:hypothetical protein n=1 Tax=unclassified Sporosarcina TaxID=2647733 RepID=UPI0020422D68|nr:MULTISPECIES: hypothetical protein [unclassified Sporosarcina]GKV67192.1 hypothetical protein NCCP2331_33450 [Sporosarcina sp. NCCP-2331]GLB57542.1 hypothetical protein NCCP2378_33310 [Sporosarcina sp. NCCP-2378]